MALYFTFHGRVTNIPDNEIGVKEYTYKFSPCQPLACTNGGDGNGIVSYPGHVCTGLSEVAAWFDLF